MTKRTIAVDCDGVLANFTGHLMMTAALSWGTDPKGPGPLPREALHGKGWECLQVIHEYYGKTMAELSNLVKTPGFCANIDVLDGAREFVDELRALEGAEVLIVTSAWSGPYWHHERLEWLWQNFKVAAKDVIFASRKEYVDADILIDDKPDNIIDWWAQQHRRGQGSYKTHEGQLTCLPVFIMSPLTAPDNYRVLERTSDQAILAPSLATAALAVKQHWTHRGWR